MKKVIVRKSDYRNEGWVADIEGGLFVLPDGTEGRYGIDVCYLTKKEAQAAADLYLAIQDTQNVVDSIEIKTGFICPGCNIKLGKGEEAYCHVGRVYHKKCFVPTAATIDKDKTIRTFGIGTTKPTNPKDALAINKAPLSTLPTGPIYEIALAMLEGARKYGRHNYRVMGVKASVYYDAAMGHITAWWEGEDIDPDSGIHHLGKAMACLAVIRDSMMMENWIDDRPPRYPHAQELMRNNPIVGVILDKHPDCIDPYTEINKNIDKYPGRENE